VPQVQPGPAQDATTSTAAAPPHRSHWLTRRLGASTRPSAG
jgi:hypothetical protein